MSRYGLISHSPMKSWIHSIIGLVFVFGLSGCGTLISKAPPTCDGFTRRPLNPSLWDVRTTFGSLTEPSDVKKSFQMSRSLSGAGVRRFVRVDPAIAFLEIPHSGVAVLRTSYDSCGSPS